MENSSGGARLRRILSRRTVLTSLIAGLAALAACGRNRSAPEGEATGATGGAAGHTVDGAVGDAAGSSTSPSASPSSSAAASADTGVPSAAPLSTTEAATNRQAIGPTSSDARLVGHPPGNLPGDSGAQVALPTPTPTPARAYGAGGSTLPDGSILPDRLVIPRIDLDIPVVELGWSTNRSNSGAIFSEWDVAAHAAGWHKNSALPGQAGNIVMSGHNNILGAVFRQLDQLRRDDEIAVYTQDNIRRYRVERVLIVPEKNATEEQRAENAQWIAPTSREQLTLVSCWPRNDNTHRIVVVARPVA